jgi:hypothetical protein
MIAKEGPFSAAEIGEFEARASNAAQASRRTQVRISSLESITMVGRACWHGESALLPPNLTQSWRIYEAHTREASGFESCIE